MDVVASLSQGRTAAAQCGLFTHKSVPVIFEPPCMYQTLRCKSKDNCLLTLGFVEKSRYAKNVCSGIL